MRRLILTILLFAATPAFAQEKPEGAPDRGKQSYTKYMCYACHGTVGQGADRGTGPQIAPKVLPYPAFALQVRNPRLDMPAFRKEFVSDQELADIYAYLSTIKPGPSLKEIPLLNFQ
jgi:mono/diheme cytochrome c family protein